MFRPLRLPLLAATLALATAAHAGDPPPEPKVERTVIEDDSNKIEELKVRGETKKVTVQPKNSKAPAYEIQVNDAGRESAGGSDRKPNGGGQRVWRILNF
jgi:hypothetical protein